MVGHDERYEYTPFGDQVLRRPVDSADDWEPVPADDIEHARAVLDEEEFRCVDERAKGGAKLAIEVMRSPRNVAVARRLSLTGDELAERLNDEGSTGTRRRVSEADFDDAMREIELDPQEARDRFAGRYHPE